MAALAKTIPVAVIGSGAMGAGIAQIAAAAGYEVLLYDANADATQKAIANIDKVLGKLVEKGKMTADEKTATVQRLKACQVLADIAPAGLVVEAIVENLDIKRKVFAEIENIVSETAILASNTSSISITSIAAGLKRPQNFVGMHFFNPVPLMQLVEIIKGLATSDAVAQTTYDTALEWRKSPVMAKSTPGFIVNRVARPFYAEGLRVLQENGGDIATLDAIAREQGGFRMGPFELMDLIGHDVNFAVTSSVFAAYFNDQRFLPNLIQKELVDGGYLGRKTGRGFYDYAEGATKPAPHTAELQNPPYKVTVYGHLGVAQPLVALMKSTGILVDEKQLEDHDGGFLVLEDRVILALTDGRMATERQAQSQLKNLVLFDLALDYEKATRIALTKSDQTDIDDLELAAGLFQELGKAVSYLDDVPGMLMMRTVCMLANEGADAVNQGVCNTQAVDIAMQKGVNYPRGPLAWADTIGLPYVVKVLDNLAQTYGEDRYRTSPLLRRRVAAGKKCHG